MNHPVFLIPFDALLTSRMLHIAGLRGIALVGRERAVSSLAFMLFSLTSRRGRWKERTCNGQAAAPSGSTRSCVGSVHRAAYSEFTCHWSGRYTILWRVYHDRVRRVSHVHAVAINCDVCRGLRLASSTPSMAQLEKQQWSELHETPFGVSCRRSRQYRFCRLL